MYQFKITAHLSERLKAFSIDGGMGFKDADADGMVEMEVSTEIFERLDNRFSDIADANINCDEDFEIALDDLVTEMEEEARTCH
jgi:hypothetical protein